jgi:hypothetical protein
MIYLSMTPEVSTVRAYSMPGGYEQRAPYLAIVTVSHLSDTMAYLHGAVGDVDRETWTKLLDMLREQGVKTVMLERRGKMKTITL